MCILSLDNARRNCAPSQRGSTNIPEDGDEKWSKSCRWPTSYMASLACHSSCIWAHPCVWSNIIKRDRVNWFDALFTSNERSISDFAQQVSWSYGISLCVPSHTSSEQLSKHLRERLLLLWHSCKSKRYGQRAPTVSWGALPGTRKESRDTQRLSQTGIRCVGSAYPSWKCTQNIVLALRCVRWKGGNKFLDCISKKQWQ